MSKKKGRDCPTGLTAREVIEDIASYPLSKDFERDRYGELKGSEPRYRRPRAPLTMKTHKISIVAFDLGSTFGVATNLRSLGTPRWQKVVLPGIREHRLAAFSSYLRASGPWLRRADVVVYETPFSRGPDATRSLWGMAGVLEAEATALGLPVVDVAVATIKKFATGKGNDPKIAMIAAARRMGYRGDNEHEADAYCLLKYAEENLEREGK